jgi:hypothetical protein
MARAPSLNFRVELSGNGLTPESVDVRVLCGILMKLESAVRSAAGQSREVAESERLLSLTGVDAGSEKLSFTASAKAAQGLKKIGRAVKRGDFSKLPPDCHSDLHHVSKELAQRSWTFKLKGTSLPEAVISEANPIPEPEAPPRRSGPRTLYGRLTRVGGDGHLRGILQLDNGENVSIAMSEDEARKLAPRIYEEIGIEGEADWDVDTRKVHRITLTRVLAYEKTDILTAFRELKEAAEGRWDGVNAKEFVKAQRSG